MSRALAAVATLRQVSSAPRRAVAVASFAARYLSTEEQKVLKELVDDKTKVLDEKVKSMVAAAGASIAYAIFRPIADAMVEKKVHEIRGVQVCAF